MKKREKKKMGKDNEEPMPIPIKKQEAKNMLPKSTIPNRKRSRT